MWTPSVRMRLTLWYTTVLAVVLLTFAGGIVVMVRRALDRELEEGLHDDLETAEQMLVRMPDGAIGWRAEPADDDEDAAVGGRWLQVRSADGDLLYVRPARAPRGVPLRQMTGRYTIDGLPVTLVAARSAEAVNDELRALLVATGIGLPVALLL